MDKHTPGPWAIEPEWADRGGGSVAIVNREHSGDDWDVCEVHSTEANAHLIVAAPELLRELQHLTRCLRPWLAAGKGVPGIATLNGADAAIAKATGATP